MGVAHVQAVAGAGEVEVVPGVVRHRAVVGLVVDAAHRQHRPEVVAFGGVVVDDVEDHLDARRVQRLDHGLELLDLAERNRRRVAVVRGEVGDRVVTPVVAQAPFDEVMIVYELVHRHQLDSGHTEVLQVFDDRRMGEPRVSAPKRRWDARMLHRESADVGLVDDRVVQRHVRWAIVAPLEVTISDHGFGHVGGGIHQVGLVWVAEVVAEACC